MMKGSTFKSTSKSGRTTWRYMIDAGRDETGKRIRVSESGFKLEREAVDAMREKMRELSESQVAKPSPRTLNDFMSEWFTQHAVRQCSPKTVERYRQLVSYFEPTLGRMRLADLTALAIERELNRLKDTGGHDRKKKEPRPLSAKTVRHIAGVLGVALNTAVRWKLIRVNPLNAVQLPKLERREAKALDETQLAWFLDVARAHCPWLHPILLFAAATGCRRGEVLALTWKDVNFTAGTVRINKSVEQTAAAGLRVKPTKTGEPRPLSLPASVVEALRQHQAEQQRNRDLFGPDYRADLDLVFCDPAGDYLKPDSITTKVCVLAKKAGLKGVGLHSLRHSHGSQLLSVGVPLPTVSKRLGHSSVYVTATVYSHALSKDELAAAEAWDAAMRKAREGELARQ